MINAVSDHSVGHPPESSRLRIARAYRVAIYIIAPTDQNSTRNNWVTHQTTFLRKNHAVSGAVRCSGYYIEQTLSTLAYATYSTDIYHGFTSIPK